MQYKRILVTGGAGFIGSHLVDHLIAHGHHVRILDVLHPQVHVDSQPPTYLNPQAEFIQGDVTNKDELRQALTNCDAVVHLAAAVGVGQSMYEIERYVKVNSLGTALLLDILANEKHSIKKILVAGSMTAFGEGMYQCPKCTLTQQPPLRNRADLESSIWEPLCQKCGAALKAIPTNETAMLNSPSIYGITKKNQEELVLAFGKAYQLPAVAFRFFNVFGPRQSLSNPYTGVTAIFMSRVKNDQAPLVNEDGQQTRDFIYVTDVVLAVTLALEKDAANYEVFNVGSGKATSVREVAEIAMELEGKKMNVELTGKFRSFDIRHCFADTSKLQKLLGWQSTVSFKKGMQLVYDWSKSETAVDSVVSAVEELQKRGLS